MSHGKHSGATAAAAVLLLACTTLALVNLPSAELPLGWLLAWVLPGALYARLPRLGWKQVLCITVLQAGAFLLALQWVGPMSRPAALACTILPPLGFATVRQQDADRALALFLSFCVMLVGVILDGPCLPLLVAYAVCACLSLRCASHLAVHAVGDSAPHVVTARSLRAVFGGSLALVIGCLFAALTVERTLAWLPSPSRQPNASSSPPTPAGRGPRQTGLDDSFVLDGKGGVLSELTGEQLVRVRDAEGRSLPPDLYLRSGFFTVASLDRWQLGKLDLTPVDAAAGHVLRRPLPGVPVHTLELQRFAAAGHFVFVPSGACAVHFLSDLVVDRGREWIRHTQPHAAEYYEIGYQVPPPLTDDVALDARGGGAGLTKLPSHFEAARYEELLSRWHVGREPVAAMDRLTKGLWQHCRYERSEPTGSWPHAIDNFLFAVGDRRGYCMHFASAAALMLRLRGIPCRIGVGLYGGEPDGDTPGARMFGAQHAHAWVEIPFAERGYVVFDPTPPAERGQRGPTPLDASDAELPKDAPVDEPRAYTLAAMFEFLLQPWLLALALLLVVATSMWPQRTRQSTTQPTTTVARSARRLLGRLLQALAAVGHARTRGQTLESFARDLARAQRLLPEVAAAFTAYQQIRFGGHSFDAAHESVLQLAIDATRGLQPLVAAVGAQEASGQRNSS